MIPKFRVWLKDLKEMYTVITMHIEHEKVICGHWRFGETVPLSYTDDKYVVLMQSTGMFDQEGVEIYEGDIVDIRVFTYVGDSNSQIGELCYYNVPLVYRKSDAKDNRNQHFEWGFMAKDEFIPFSYFPKLDDESFIIKGNLYENPELIKKYNRRVLL